MSAELQNIQYPLIGTKVWYNFLGTIIIIIIIIIILLSK